MIHMGETVIDSVCRPSPTAHQAFGILKHVFNTLDTNDCTPGNNYESGDSLHLFGILVKRASEKEKEIVSKIIFE